MSYVDIAWPWGLVVIGIVNYLYNDGTTIKILLSSIVVCLIGLRMGIGAISLWKKGYLNKELSRYEYQRIVWKKEGKPNTHLALQVDAITQGMANSTFLAIPIFLIGSNTNSLNVIEYLGLSVFLLSIIFESFADWQKLNFLKSMKIQGLKNQVCDIGLWKYTRHPNYFFETLKKCEAIPQLLPELDLPQLHNADDPIFQALKHFAGQDRMAEERFTVFLTRAGNYGLLENGEKTQIKNLIERLKLNRRTAETYTMYLDFNEKIMNYASLGEQDILHLFEEMDTFRRPEKFTGLLKILGHVIEPDQSSSHIKKLTSFFMEALSKTSKLSARSFFTPEEIAKTDYSTISQRLRIERAKKIRETIIEYRTGLKSVDE
mgnify:CR=1 FL=1